MEQLWHPAGLQRPGRNEQPVSLMQRQRSLLAATEHTDQFEIQYPRCCHAYVPNLSISSSPYIRTHANLYTVCNTCTYALCCLGLFLVCGLEPHLVSI